MVWHAARVAFYTAVLDSHRHPFKQSQNSCPPDWVPGRELLGADGLARRISVLAPDSAQPKLHNERLKSARVVVDFVRFGALLSRENVAKSHDAIVPRTWLVFLSPCEPDLRDLLSTKTALGDQPCVPRPIGTILWGLWGRARTRVLVGVWKSAKTS